MTRVGYRNSTFPITSLSNKSTGADYPWSKTVSELEKSNMINIIPYEVHLDYDYWDYRTSTENF